MYKFRQALIDAVCSFLYAEDFAVEICHEEIETHEQSPSSAMRDDAPMIYSGSRD